MTESGVFISCDTLAMKSERKISFLESSAAIEFMFSQITSYSSYLPHMWRGFKWISKSPRAILPVARSISFKGSSARARLKAAPAAHSAAESTTSTAAVTEATTAELPPVASFKALLTNIEIVATAATAKKKIIYSVKVNEERWAPYLLHSARLLPSDCFFAHFPASDTRLVILKPPYIRGRAR